MTTATPPRTDKQRMDALTRANDIRSRRARLKRELTAATENPIRYIAKPPAWACTMKVWDLLRAVRGQGRVKVAKALKRAGVSESKTLAGLTARQREELIAWLKR